MARDLVEQLSKIDKTEDLNIFVKPWNSPVYNLETENMRMGHIWQEEVNKDLGLELQELSDMMEHSDLVGELTKWTNSLVRVIKPGCVIPPIFGRTIENPPLLGAMAAPVPFAPVIQGNFAPPVQPPIQPPVQPPTPWSNFVSGPDTRQRTDSFKRKRTENPGTSAGSSTGRKAVMGTGNSTLNGRKMKSPPVDIFVWGLPKDTEEEDIVNDLAVSGIQITRADV